jgi:hypothetical protein
MDVSYSMSRVTTTAAGMISDPGGDEHAGDLRCGLGYRRRRQIGQGGRYFVSGGDTVSVTDGSGTLTVNWFLSRDYK